MFMMNSEMARARRTTLCIVVLVLGVCKAEECFPQPHIKTGMQFTWIHEGEFLNVPPAPPNTTILRGPFQLPPEYNPAYGTACPKSGPINFQYYTEINTANPRITLLVPSSNITLEPFSNPLIPVEQLQAGQLKKPTAKTCDAKGRCIEAYELKAGIVEADVGFKTPDGQPMLSQYLAFDGQVPGPRFQVQQGVQTLVRLHNHIHCNTTTWKKTNSSCSYYKIVDKLSLHNHGGSSLSPFDGWAPEAIHACEWKDYVFSNEKSSPNWYHDHALELTAITSGMGLAGSYNVLPCDKKEVPSSLQVLGQPQYLILSDMVFFQQQGSKYMNPSLFPGTSNSLQGNDAAQGDHIIVNGRAWPQVSVQRRPYWFIVHNAAQARTFDLYLRDQNLNLSAPMWIVGAEGGLRTTPVLQETRMLMGSGERYQVVIDFSKNSPGDEVFFFNLPGAEANFGQSCYAHLVIKFVVGDKDPPSAPFNPNYSKPLSGVGYTQAEIDSVCEAAEGQKGAGVRMDSVQDVPAASGQVLRAFTSVAFDKLVEKPQQWVVAMTAAKRRQKKQRSMLRAASTQEQVQGEETSQPDTAVEAFRLSSQAGARQAVRPNRLRQLRNSSQNPGGLPYVVQEFMPFSMAQNSWVTWSVYNSGPGIHPHPIHVHSLHFFLCSRTNNVTNTTLEPYEINSPKDTMYSRTGDIMTLAARFGPHQGSFQFHCHNLVHEDQGMMGQFNITSITRPAIHTVFVNGTVASSNEFGMGVGAFDKSAVDFRGSDPLVQSVPADPRIGHKLFYPGSMPPWAQRTDPKHPGRPQPLTTNLLKKVLKRNYYKVFYPDGRSSLSEPVADNAWAVVCPAP